MAWLLRRRQEVYGDRDYINKAKAVIGRFPAAQTN